MSFYYVLIYTYISSLGVLFEKTFEKIWEMKKVIYLFVLCNEFCVFKRDCFWGGRRPSFWTGSQSKLPSVLPMETENTREFLVLPFLSPAYYDYRQAHTQNKIICKKLEKFKLYKNSF